MLTFDPIPHEYRVDGVRVPSVTEILRQLTDFSGIPAAVLEAKRDLGQRVHFACQLDDENDLDASSVEDDVAPYLAAWRKFLAESGAKIVSNEERVYDPILRYAGTLDNVLDIAGVHWLTDKKTSIYTPIAAGPQTSAYLRARRDPRPMSRAAVRLRPDGTYRFDALYGADDFSTFLACLNIYRFKESHA
jgi:hypothetical protein